MPTKNKIVMMHPREQLVEIMRRIYSYSMTTTSGGNLSLLDNNGDMWITPAGIDKGNLSSEHMVCITKEGKIIGRHKPSSEYPFHQMIYLRNPRIKAILHAHPPALTAFSIIRQIPNTRVIPQANEVCGKMGLAKYATPGTDELADYISDEFKKGSNTVILENHGVVTAGDNLLIAFQRFETLDFCARILIRAGMLGKKIISLNDEQIKKFAMRQNKLPEFVPKEFTNRELELRAEISDFAKRAYDQRIMTSTEGTISARVDGNSFLITPYGVDRKYLSPKDVVLVKSKKREKGKLPSRAVLMHDSIYKDHPEINAIVTAQAPNIMAYGITGTKLDTRTIPENYILLRNIPLLEYGLQYKGGFSSKVSLRDPVVVLQNDAVLAVGTTLLSAYDRLEVAERAAETVILSLSIGKTVLLNDAQVLDLEKKFLR